MATDEMCRPVATHTDAANARMHRQTTQTTKTAMTRRNIIVTAPDHARLSDMIAFGRLPTGEHGAARALKSELDRAEIVAPDSVPGDIITMNSCAELLDL